MVFFVNITILDRLGITSKSRTFPLLVQAIRRKASSFSPLTDKGVFFATFQTPVNEIEKNLRPCVVYLFEWTHYAGYSPKNIVGVKGQMHS